MNRSEVLNSVCPVCKSPDGKRIHKMEASSFWRCKNCGLEYIWPQPETEQLNSEYQDYYAGQRVDKAFDAVTELALPVLRMNIDNAFGEVAHATLRFLDVGCGGGHFVRAAQILGFEAYGIEVDRQAAENAQKKGLNVLKGSLPHPDLPSDSFDLIKLMHVVEHVPDPNALFIEVAKLLKPGGVIWVDVPNQASFMAVMKKGLHFLGLGDYGYLQPPLHLTAFNKKSLKALFRETGFSAKKIMRSSPVDNKTFPSLPDMYSTSFKYRLFRFLYKVSWRFGDSPYMSMMASYSGRGKT